MDNHPSASFATTISSFDKLKTSIENRSARAGIVGLGYVGLPLAVEIGRTGFSVSGFDPDPHKIEALAGGRSYISDVSDIDVRELSEQKILRADSDPAILDNVDIISVCVPTPLQKTRDPDLSYVLSATRTIRDRLREGMLIILESTTYPGTTVEMVLPILEESGLRVGRDFFLCFSPERVDPGNEKFSTANIPKVIGGVTPECTRLGELFYGQVVASVVPVSSTTVAEMVKLLENTFRMINIGLANEMAIICHRMGVDVWEVIEAAATKPFGFMPFYPGPGLGGHCIPVDPHYLSWRVRQIGHEPRFIQLASEINGSMPQVVVRRVQEALNHHRKSLNGSVVHLAGVAYKRNVSDTRESPAIDIIELLIEAGAKVGFSDPFVERLTTKSASLPAEPLEAAASRADCVLICTDHDGIDYQQLARLSMLIVDTRNALKGCVAPHIFRL